MSLENSSLNNLASLKDKVIISTQPEESFPEFAKLLLNTGAQIYNYPMITVVESTLSPEQQNFLFLLSKFNWLIFTSKNGVHFFFQKLKTITGSEHLPMNVKTAVIGKKTAKELLKYAVQPDYVSESNLAELFALELKEKVILKGQSVLLPLGNLAGTTIESALQNHTSVQRINVYETSKPLLEEPKYIDIIASGKYDLIIFTSSSGFHNFADIIKKQTIDFYSLKVASIGKSTTKTMREYGVEPVFTARQSNMEGIVEEIYNLFIL